MSATRWDRVWGGEGLFPGLKVPQAVQDAPERPYDRQETRYAILGALWGLRAAQADPPTERISAGRLKAAMMRAELRRPTG